MLQEHFNLSPAWVCCRFSTRCICNYHVKNTIMSLLELLSYRVEMTTSCTCPSVSQASGANQVTSPAQLLSPRHHHTGLRTSSQRFEPDLQQNPPLSSGLTLKQRRKFLGGCSKAFGSFWAVWNITRAEEGGVRWGSLFLYWVVNWILWDDRCPHACMSPYVSFLGTVTCNDLLVQRI